MNHLQRASLFLVCLPVLVLIGASTVRAQSKRLVQVPISDAPSYDKRALVVGVTDYALAPQLHVCANDAKEFARLLKDRMGFTDVTLMTDDPATPLSLRPTCANLRRAVHGLLKDVVPGKSEVVFFYSGHGVRLSSESDWLVPEDGDPQDITRTCVNYTQIVEALNTERPKRAFLITDACRSLLSGKGVGGSGFGKGLERVTLGPQVAEMLSCEPTEVSQEGIPTDFSESVFTHFLVKGLEGDPDALEPGTHDVTFDSLMGYIQGSVSNYVHSHFNSSQTPDGRATQGRMVLARIAALPPGTRPPSVTPPLTPLSPTAPPAPVARPSATPAEQQQANARLLGLWTTADGKPDQVKIQALTVAAVEQALDAGADVNARDSIGGTTLMAAVRQGSADMVRLLLDRGADINIKGGRRGQLTALGMATRSGNAEVIRLLQDRVAVSALPTLPQSTPAGHQQADAQLIGLWTAPDGNPDPAKTLALTVGAVEQALDAGANVNARDSVGGTILVAAALNGSADIVRLLLSKGADVNAMDMTGQSPLKAAAFSRHADLVPLLLDKKADINARNRAGATMLITAAFSGRVDVIRLLIAKGADVNAKKNDGWTALMYARKFNRSDIAAILRAAGEKE